MFDQADKLRQLVRETIKENAALEPGVPLVVVTGAQQGIGTSSVSIRLAEELVQLGKRVVLVDANLLHPALADTFNVQTRHGIGDVFSGCRSAVETLEPISSGFSLLPARRDNKSSLETNIRALRSLISELRTLDSHADLIVLDGGFGMTPWVERLWMAALQILLVTSTNTAALRDAYAAVKMSPWGDVDGKLRLVVNRCDDSELASRVGQGLSSTCRKFLGMKLIGNASQLCNDTSRGYRSSVRLLAADVLSQSCLYTQRVHITVPKAALMTAAVSLPFAGP